MVARGHLILEGATTFWLTAAHRATKNIVVSCFQWIYTLLVYCGPIIFGKLCIPFLWGRLSRWSSCLCWFLWFQLLKINWQPCRYHLHNSLCPSIGWFKTPCAQQYDYFGWSVGLCVLTHLDTSQVFMQSVSKWTFTFWGNYEPESHYIYCALAYLTYPSLSISLLTAKYYSVIWKICYMTSICQAVGNHKPWFFSQGKL